MLDFTIARERVCRVAGGKVIRHTIRITKDTINPIIGTRLWTKAAQRQGIRDQGWVAHRTTHVSAQSNHTYKQPPIHRP